jgi:hypothetical protein
MEDIVEIYTLWDRLKKRFSIVKPQPKSFSLNDTVQPVTSVDFPLTVTKLLTGMTSVSSNGYKAVHVVPAGKRWEVHAIDLWQTGGTFDCIAFYITGDSSAAHIHRFTAAAKETYHCPYPVPLNEKWKIEVEVENYAASGSIYLFILYKETDMEE